MFFTRFLFSITYRPGSQNPKVDALFRLHAPDQPSEPEPILPPALIVSPIQWDLTRTIRDATRTEPSPQGGPEGKPYIPSSQRLTLLGSVHKVPDSGHPGSQRTLSLLQARYWWPSMAEGVIRYVRSCSVCAISKTPRHLPAGKLVPLPVPQRPWSHIGVDFITDLPNSEGHVRAHGSGPFLQGLPVNPPERSIHSTRDGRKSIPPCFPELRSARRHRVRPGSPVHITGMESLLSAPWGNCQLVPLIQSPD